MILKRGLFSLITIATVCLFIGLGSLNTSADELNNTDTLKNKVQNLPSETYPVNPDVPVTINVDGKIIQTNHADFMQNKKTYLSGHFNPDFTLNSKLDTADVNRLNKPQYLGSNISLTYTSNSYRGSGSSSNQNASFYFSNVNVNNGDYIRASNYLTNPSSNKRAFFFRLGWNSNKMDFIETENITRCKSITSYSVGVSGTNHEIWVYYGDPAVPSSTVYPGEQACSQVKFKWKGGSSSYNWRNLNNNSILFQSGERGGGVTVDHFYSTDYVKIN